MSIQKKKKIDSFCTRFSLYQAITQSTHFTEHSSSLIDITSRILVSNNEQLISIGVGDPLLNWDIHYHCPVFGILKCAKPKSKVFEREIWIYNNGYYAILREKNTLVDWDTLKDDNVDQYAENFQTTIFSLSKECIPFKKIKIRPSDPPWLTSILKRKIRKLKRAYKKAKRIDQECLWAYFKKLRNEVTYLIKNWKQSCFWLNRRKI